MVQEKNLLSLKLANQRGKTQTGNLKKMNHVYATLRIGLMQLVSLYSMVCFIASFIEARKNNN